MTSLSNSAPQTALSGQQFLIKILPLLLGLLLMYVPTYIGLIINLWIPDSADAHTHEPLFTLVVLWLLWQQREQLCIDRPPSSNIVTWLVFGFGLVMYAVGRSQSLLLLEVGSQSLVIGAGLCLALGRGTLRVIWFPMLFLLFMVPLPGALVDSMTGPLKAGVSALAESTLYSFGLPVARSGVIISVGPYELLVADACSGLRSLFSLFAVSMLYVNIMGYKSVPRILLLIAAGFPIAFFTNVARVMVLVVVTYYFGDAAGQGVIHGAAGMVLYLVALLLVFLLDSIYGWVAKAFSKGDRV